MGARFVPLFCFTICCGLCFGQYPAGKLFSLNECGRYPKYQQYVVNDIDLFYKSLSLLADSAVCIDCSGCKVGAFPHTWSCDKSNNNQWWNLELVESKANTFRLESNHKKGSCLGAGDTSAFGMLDMQKCNRNEPLQQFTIGAPTANYFQSVANASLCLTAAYYPYGNCSVAPYNEYPYCDQSLPTGQRVDDLLSRMSISEKIFNLQNNNAGVPRLGVPPNRYNEALHGVVCGCGKTYQGNTGCPTSFPHATLMAASFNRSLWKAVGQAISDEARALNNQGISGLFYWAPDINLFRDPRWGRGQETPGEDPFLTSEYVSQYVPNMQHGEDTRYLKVVSTAKHFADYDQEGNYGTSRSSFDANVTDQDQVEYYWVPFRAAIERGDVQSIMCSYNAVNSIPMCGNDLFMNQVARKQYGFDGFFVSDCGAIGDKAFTRYVQQHYDGDPSQQSRVALEGGCDTNCGTYYAANLPTAVEKNIVSEDDVNIATKRLFTRSFALGMMDTNPASFYTTYGPEKVDSPQHRQLALHAAVQGIVLLKNNGSLLPFSDAKTKNMEIALIGPHAKATQDMLSIYRGDNKLVNSHSPYQAMVARDTVNNVTYAEGCDDISCASDAGFAAAVAAAKRADIAIVVLGLHPGRGFTAAREDEGWDRLNVSFPGKQLSLLQKVHQTGTPTVLVLINGGPLDLSWPKANVDAILEAFYPGELGGDALMAILFGDESPAGKLPVTVYDMSLMKARPSIMDMSLRDNGGITYRYYKGQPVYPFGFGLSYTTFQYVFFEDEKDVGSVFSVERVKKGDVSFVIQVTNVGPVRSDCVVLGFVTSDDEDAPPIKLFDFQRVHVLVGQSVNVTLSVSPESISVTNKAGQERVVPGKYEFLMGDYPSRKYVTVRRQIVGEELVLFDLKRIKEEFYQNR